MTHKTVAQAIAAAVVAMRNCEQSGNVSWHARWSDYLDRIARECLPSGSGFDSGTKIDPDDTRADRLVLSTAFHHMNETGMYDGWTQHVVTVRPQFDGIAVSVSGRDRDGIKAYVAETFHVALLAAMPAGLVP